MISRLSIERRKNIDWLLIASIYVLVIISFISVNSAVSMLEYKERIIRTQILAILIGSLVMIFVWFFDYDILDEYSTHIYLAGLFSLLLVLLFGVADRGSRSWFRFGLFSIQPSEFARISLLIFVSSYLSRSQLALADIGNVIKLFLFILPFFILMIKQPDFSGILITFFPLIVLFLLGGMDLRYFYFFALFIGVSLSVPLFGVIVNIKPELLSNDIVEMIYSTTNFNLNMVFLMIGILILTIVLWYFIKKFNPLVMLTQFIVVYILFVGGYIAGVFIKDQIKEYQYRRVESFIYPEKDPRGAGYNIIQARVALGSGGFYGKGIFKGSQGRLGFIPERHTDFIVSVIGEEMGFIGVLGVIVLYLIILSRLKMIIMSSRNIFGFYLVSSFAALLMGYFFVNIGMIIGFFPVAGVPLPFLSYGGSNLVASFLMIGIAQSVFRRRISIA